MNRIKLLAEDELNIINSGLTNLFVGNEKIYYELKNFINSPKKRIRSLCAILYFKGLGVNIGNDLSEILIIGELIHNASLLHDDVIDSARLRRDNLTLWAKYSPQVSILSGDLLVSFATEKLIKLKNFEIIKFFQICTQNMSEAEIKQYFLRGKKTTLEEYISIADGKTSSLFKAIFKSCALITNININKAEMFAKNFGILFQLKNDLEECSAQSDKQNKIFTPKDILGIEKTHILIDNYLEDIRRDLEEFPESIYKQGLTDLLNNL